MQGARQPLIAASPVPKPQRRRGRLHRLVDHPQNLGRGRVQIDLVAQAGAARLDGLGRMVLAPVEAPVDPCWMRRRASWNRTATARVAPATTQLGGSSPMPPNSCPSASTMPE